MILNHNAGISAEHALPDLNISHSDLKHAAESLILSASGWRKIFGPSDDSMDADISAADIVLAALIADTFSIFVKAYYGRNSVLCLARDARPTGPFLSAICKSILESNGIKVCETGVTSAPEAMCLVKKTDDLDGLDRKSVV